MDNIDTLRQKASELVKEAFREKLEEATQNRLSVFESRDAHITEEEEEDHNHVKKKITMQKREVEKTTMQRKRREENERET